MRIRGKYKHHWYLLPEGYDLQKDKETYSGYVVCNRKLKRYIWTPKSKDLFYEPTTKTIFRFMDWNDKSPAGLTSICGFGKIIKIKGGKSLWVDLSVVLRCIPIEKIIND